MRRALLIASLFAAVSSLHCGPGPGMYAKGSTAQKSSPGATAAEPAKSFDFTTEMKKEATGLRSFPLSAPDGSFSATISAVAAPKISAKDERSVSFAIDIGSKRPIDCAIFARRIDTATTLWKLVFEPIEKMPTTELLTLDIGADDDRPQLTLHMAALNEKREVHVLKATVVSLADTSVVCQHEEVGYAATAKAAALELARTLKKSVPAPPARFHDLAIFKVGGVAIGWTERFIIDRADGLTFETEYGGLLASADGKIIAKDDASATELDRDGLIKAVTKGEGGPQGLITKLAVLRKAGTEYEVDGVLDGEKLHVTLKSKKPLRGVALLAQDIVANARAGRAVPLSEESFSWSGSTKEIATSLYTRTPKFDPNAPSYSVKTGEDEYSVAFDAQGMLTQLNGKVKDSPVEATRLFAKGNPQRKK